MSSASALWTSLSSSTPAEKALLACAVLCILLAGVARWSQKKEGEKRRPPPAKKRRKATKAAPVAKANGRGAAAASSTVASRDLPDEQERVTMPSPKPTASDVLEDERPVVHVDPDNGDEWQTVPRRRKNEKKNRGGAQSPAATLP